MMKFEHIVPSSDLRRGPFPLRATIDAELREHEEKLSDYRINSSLGSKAIVPLYLEIHVPIVGEEKFPEMFARAYEADTAPLYQDKDRQGSGGAGRGYDPFT